MEAPGAVALAGIGPVLAPFRNRRAVAGGRPPGEPPFGGAERAPIWLESVIRLLLHAIWAAAAAAGGAQLSPHLVGGAVGERETAEPPQVARMLERVDALLAVAEAGMAGRAEERATVQWGAIAAAAVAAASLCLLGWYAALQACRSNSLGGRARALMELSIALDQGGAQAAEQMAAAAGVDAKAVYGWHAAWKTAWRGPG